MNRSRRRAGATRSRLALCLVALVALGACSDSGSRSVVAAPGPTVAPGAAATVPAAAPVVATSPTAAPTTAPSTSSSGEGSTTTDAAPEASSTTEAGDGGSSSGSEADDADSSSGSESGDGEASGDSGGGDGTVASGGGGGGGFTFEVAGITGDIAARMVGVSWREGCPVPLEGLRYLRVGYWGFDGAAHVGELVVNADAVGAMETAFGQLFDAGFPIRRMQLVDDYGGDDDASIEADNTSAFNCRAATGSSNWSQHAYGLAIDVNPIENPYVYADGTTTHPASEPYLDRSTIRPGMARSGGALVAAFSNAGWGWGGWWGGPTDYQHFSASGG